jgi:NDP-sugar pyrophosphorylase family protein
MAGGAVALGGTGISILAPEILEQIPAVPPIEIDHDLVGTLFRGGLPVFVQRARGYWMHIDSPAKYLQVHRDILGGNLSLERFPMAAAFADGPRAGEGSLIAPGVTVHDGARVEGSVIGPNCTVAAGAELVDSVLWSGNAIGEYARISGSVLGRGCFVGASVILPRGTVLGGKSSITEYSRFSPA